MGGKWFGLGILSTGETTWSDLGGDFLSVLLISHLRLLLLLVLSLVFDFKNSLPCLLLILLSSSFYNVDHVFILFSSRQPGQVVFPSREP